MHEPHFVPFYDPEQMRCLLPFEFKEKVGFEAQTQRPFRPSGVAIWGAPAGATVLFFSGVNVEGLAAYGEVPARFFAMGDSFEQISKLLDAGKEPPAWITWNAVAPGGVVRVQVRNHDHGSILGPSDGIEVAMWGIALKQPI